MVIQIEMERGSSALVALLDTTRPWKSKEPERMAAQEVPTSGHEVIGRNTLIQGTLNGFHNNFRVSAN